MANQNVEHEKVLQLIQEKINVTDGVANPKLLERYQALYRLVSNNFRPFFSKVDMGVAYSILEDIGVSKDQISETYRKLISEEIKKNHQYVYVDPQQLKK